MFKNTFKLKSSSFAAAFILASVFSSAVARAADPAENAAIVLEATDGTASVEGRHAGKWAPLAIGAKLNVGDSVRTPAGTSARLLYPDGSLIALSTDSEIQIDHDPVRVISLRRGTVWGKIQKLVVASASPTPSSPSRSPYKFILRAKAVTMGVRGTEFIVESGANGAVSVLTLEGTVDTAPDLASLRAGKTVPVHQLELVHAQSGTAFGKAEAFHADEVMAHVKKDHGGLARFLGRPVSRPE
jgi:hypothetical protein